MYFYITLQFLSLMMGPYACEGTHQGVLGSSSPFGPKFYLARRNNKGFQIPPFKVKYDSTIPFLLLLILFYSSYVCWMITDGIS